MSQLAGGRVTPLHPGRGSPVDIGDIGVAELQQVAGRRQAPLTGLADGHHRSLARHLGDALLELAQGDQVRLGYVPGCVFPGLANIEDERRRFATQPLAQLGHIDLGDSCRHPTIVNSKDATSVCVELSSVSKGQQYLQFFGSDALKRLHGCAMAEIDRGADSPCEKLAQPLRRPQLGFGNPQAPIVFISPSPLDAASATNDAFAEWLDHEAGLQHHMTSETPHPYFQYVRNVLTGARKRLGQPADKHDLLDFAFHTWAVRCATENPDRVTDAALSQCTERHLQSLLATISPRVIVALGGPVARHFWWQTVRTWDGWGTMTALHGRVLQVSAGDRTIPAILSVHPYQRGIDLHPEVIARALGDLLRPEQLQAAELKAA